ncbi:MAG: aldose 1-epimerase [Actinobacteria bacterium]|nr:aldose 1-epimerase [Actinomycetota bacterium]
MPPSVTHTTTDGHPTTRLTSASGDLAATYAPGAGMVCCSLRHRGEEILGQRGGLATYIERGSTFGIPLLYPWANRLSGLRYEVAGHEVLLDPSVSPIRLDANGLPIHGLLAACPNWEVTDTGADGDAAVLRARLDFGAEPALMAAFPFPHLLEMAVRLDDTGLAITTTVTPTGDVPVPAAFGFHPYLALPGGTRDGVEITLPVERHALLDERGLPTGAGEPVSPLTVALTDQSFDDLYDRIAPAPRFTLRGAGREVTVAFDDGYPVAQVYAPADQPFICFEPMTAPTNALVTGDQLPAVDPGDVFRATFHIAVRECGGDPGAMSDHLP